MSGGDLSAQILVALKACANESAGADAPLVSVTMEFMRDKDRAEVSASVTRKTRTLIFVAAEARTGGAIVATASSVHKIRS
jgi:hypothetical protein